jgi:hypothetical protein
VSGSGDRGTIPGTLAAALFLEPDHDVVPATYPVAGQRALAGHDPDPGPCHTPERRPIGISGDDDNASLMTRPPGSRNGHADQVRYLNLTGSVYAALHHAILRTGHDS